MSNSPRGDAGAELRRMILDSGAKALEIARFLDGLDSAQRIAAVRTLGRAEQRRLYALADGFRELHLSDLVPPTVGELVTVRHFGRNTLPLFRHFEKRFCRPRGADPNQPDRLFGYNHSPTAPLVGPGVFVARAHPSRPEVLIDYRELPDEQPPGWPEIRPNDRGLARFVYGFMVDTLRGMSEHVSIGSAARNGRDLGSWFVLCREAEIGG